MSFLQHCIYLIVISGCLLLSFSGHAQENLEKTPVDTQLFIGIQDNRMPYSFFDQEQQPQGVMVESITRLCQQIDAECNFVTADFDQLLHQVQTLQINGLAIIDSLVLPEIDQLSLTKPLCLPEIVFIQRETDNPQTTPEDFRGNTLGALEGSLLHLHLLEEYDSNNRLKPYLVLESGIVDLLSQRVDALLTDRAFFQARVTDVKLDKEGLTAFKVEKAEISPLMTLAVHRNNGELLDKLEKAIATSGETPSCTTTLAALGEKISKGQKLQTKQEKP